MELNLFCLPLDLSTVWDPAGDEELLIELMNDWKSDDDSSMSGSPTEASASDSSSDASSHTAAALPPPFTSSPSLSSGSSPSVPRRAKAPRRRQPLKRVPRSPRTKVRNRLERNRRLAAESRVRKKKELSDLKEQVAALTRTVAELSAENEELRSAKRQRVAGPAGAATSSLFLFALIFSFFANPAAMLSAATTASAGQGPLRINSSSGSSLAPQSWPEGDSTFAAAPSVFDYASAASCTFDVALPVRPKSTTAAPRWLRM
jgi:hypothetical protein